MYMYVNCIHVPSISEVSIPLLPLIILRSFKSGSNKWSHIYLRQSSIGGSPSNRATSLTNIIATELSRGSYVSNERLSYYMYIEWMSKRCIYTCMCTWKRSEIYFPVYITYGHIIMYMYKCIYSVMYLVLYIVKI